MAENLQALHDIVESERKLDYQREKAFNASQKAVLNQPERGPLATLFAVAPSLDFYDENAQDFYTLPNFVGQPIVVQHSREQRMTNPAYRGGAIGGVLLGGISARVYSNRVTESAADDSHDATTWLSASAIFELQVDHALAIGEYPPSSLGNPDDPKRKRTIWLGTLTRHYNDMQQSHGRPNAFGRYEILLGEESIRGEGFGNVYDAVLARSAASEASAQ